MSAKVFLPITLFDGPGFSPVATQYREPVPEQFSIQINVDPHIVHYGPNGFFSEFSVRPSCIVEVQPTQSGPIIATRFRITRSGSTATNGPNALIPNDYEHPFTRPPIQVISRDQIHSHPYPPFFRAMASERTESEGMLTYQMIAENLLRMTAEVEMKLLSQLSTVDPQWTPQNRLGGLKDSNLAVRLLNCHITVSRRRGTYKVTWILEPFLIISPEQDQQSHIEPRSTHPRPTGQEEHWYIAEYSIEVVRRWTATPCNDQEEKQADNFIGTEIDKIVEGGFEYLEADMVPFQESSYHFHEILELSKKWCDLCLEAAHKKTGIRSTVTITPNLCDGA